MTPLSLTGKRWLLPHRTPSGQEGTDAHRIVEMLRAERGIAIDSSDEIGMDARLFPDLPVAIARVQEAVTDKETIGIFGDYDCDGITSTVMLARYFHRRGVQPVLRLPHRLTEGYGIKENHVREFAQAGVTLLIMVDTGIASADEVAQAKAAGMDVIILDHHRVPAILPVPLAILHPSLTVDCPEPFPAAAGITWSFVRALEEADGHTDWEDRQTDIALGCIGTIADVVDVRGTNRSLVQHGLAALTQMRTGPLAFLSAEAGLLDACTSRDVAFRIAPRLNAAGRMSDPHIALQALLGQQDALRHLEDLNRERQEIVALHLAKALPSMEESSAPFLFLASDQYSPGIVGLIAGKLTERFGKPSLVASVRGKTCVASLRSVPGYHITEALDRVRDLLTSFGGHAQAAGCSFPLANAEKLAASFADDVPQFLSMDDLSPSLGIDMTLEPRHLTLTLCQQLLTLEPFGQGNLEPRFLLENIRLSDVRKAGKDQTHLQARVGAHKLIGFGHGHLADYCDQPVDLVCRVSLNTWNGIVSPQLMLEDMRLTAKSSELRLQSSVREMQNIKNSEV